MSGDTTSSLDVTATDYAGVEIPPVFYMGATLKTANALDQNIKVVWTDSTRVYFSRAPQTTTGAILIPDRAATVFGLETKKVILSTLEGNPVRNRVQVYPTKLSASNVSPTAGGGPNSVRLRFKKTPLFQSTTAVSGAYKLSTEYTIDNTKSPLPTDATAVNYLPNGEFTYGWFRARVNNSPTTVFGKLYRDGDAYYFENRTTLQGTITLIAGNADDVFLRDIRFDSDGTALADQTLTTKALTEKEGLSSILLATDPVVPIPDTGINVATIYLQNGTEQFDLSTYFDYNKEYLSFPLTDLADSLYFAVDSDTAHGSDATDDDAISLGVTWEEQ